VRLYKLVVNYKEINLVEFEHYYFFIFLIKINVNDKKTAISTSAKGEAFGYPKFHKITEDSHIVQ
jgi:hypothetical protein